MKDLIQNSAEQFIFSILTEALKKQKMEAYSYSPLEDLTNHFRRLHVSVDYPDNSYFLITRYETSVEDTYDFDVEAGTYDPDSSASTNFKLTSKFKRDSDVNTRFEKLVETFNSQQS